MSPNQKALRENHELYKSNYKSVVLPATDVDKKKKVYLVDILGFTNNEKASLTRLLRTAGYPMRTENKLNYTTLKDVESAVFEYDKICAVDSNMNKKQGLNTIVRMWNKINKHLVDQNVPR